MPIQNSNTTECGILGYIDEPTPQKVFDSDDISCAGWFYSDNGIKSVTCYIDDQDIGTAKLGIFRHDVKQAFPQFPDIETAGFTFSKTVFLPEGNHSLSVKIVSNNNDIRVLSKPITVNKSVAFIERINIELTNCCNLSCRWCAGSGDRKKGFMEFKLFTLIFEQILSDEIKVNEVHIYNAGESCYHPDFEKFIEYIGKFTQRPKIVLVTNATLLSDALSDKIIKSKATDVIHFSVDGGTQESYEWLRRGANWNTTIKNIENFLDKNNGSIKTGLITIDQSVPFSDEFKNFIPRFDFFDFRPPHNWTGQESLKDYSASLKKFNPHPCWFSRNNIVIFWNGDVTICCADFHGRGVFGNVRSRTIFDLWKGERLNIYREQIAGRKDEIPLCKSCCLS